MTDTSPASQAYHQLKQAEAFLDELNRRDLGPDRPQTISHKPD